MAVVLPKLPASVFDGVATGAAERQETVTAEGGLVPVVYGRQPLGASVFAWGMIGTDLVLGCGWCLGEIDAVESLTINGQPPAESVSVTHYLGTTAQGVDPTLAEAIAGYDDTLTAAIKGVVVAAAYSVVRIPQGATAGFPRVEAILRGLKIYDPDADVTEYSANAALAMRDFIKSTIYGPGGDVVDEDVIVVAEACDEALSDGSLRREIGLVIDRAAPCSQWVDVLRSYAGCFVVRSGSTVKLVPDRPAASVADLSDPDIVEGTLRLSKRPMRRAPTVMRVIYTDDSSTPWRDMSAVAYLPGVREGEVPWREESVQMPGITRHAQAYREAVERLNAATLTDLDAEMVLYDEGLRFEGGEVVQLSHAIGLASKALRILSIDRYATGRWKVTAAEYNAEVYSDSIITGPGADSPLPSPSSIGEVTELGTFSGSEHLLEMADGTIISRMLVTWTPPVNLFYSHTEVRYRRAGDASFTNATPGLASTYCSPVEDGKVYEVEARAMNSFGVPSAWRQITHQIVGKTENPPPMRQFLFSQDPDGGRRFTWQPPDPLPKDVKSGGGYKILYGIGFEVEIEGMVPLHEGILVGSPYETNQLAAGNYSFAGVTVDSSGNQSEPRYIEAALDNPRLAGALEVQQSHVEGWPGTKTDCWIHPGTGWLVAKDTKTWADFATDGIKWGDWLKWARAPHTMVYTGVVIDIGLVTRFTPLLSGFYAGTCTFEINISEDNSVWSGWFVPSGPVTARYIQPRATVAPIANAPTILKAMTLILDATVITEEIIDLDTSTLTAAYRIGVGDIRLPITKAYGIIRQIGNFTLQNVGAGWSWELIDKDLAVGPRIKIYNGSHSLADATIDATVRGLPP